MSHNAAPLACQLWASSATSPLTIAAGEDSHTLIVIDWISVSGTGTATYVVGANGQQLNRTEVTTGGTVYIDFSSGFPCWAATANDGAVTAAPTITATGPTSNLNIIVGYHYAQPSFVRH